MASGCPIRTLNCAVCLALWMCAAAAGPAVHALSVCVLRVPQFALARPFFGKRCFLVPGAVDVCRSSRAHGVCTLYMHAQQDVHAIVAYRTPGMRQSTGVSRLPTSLFPFCKVRHDPGVLSDARRRGRVLRQPGPL